MKEIKNTPFLFVVYEHEQDDSYLPVESYVRKEDAERKATEDNQSRVDYSAKMREIGCVGHYIEEIYSVRKVLFGLPIDFYSEHIREKLEICKKNIDNVLDNEKLLAEIEEPEYGGRNMCLASNK